MIPFNFEYYKPSSLSEADGLFQTLYAQGKQPLYYSGGTEIITLARLDQLRTGAVIDIKGIPECNALHMHPGLLVIGAAVPLTAVSDSGLFPLLGKTCDEIADRTARNKITLGGNICGQFMYREAILPLLLSDSTLVVFGPTGVRKVPVHQALVEQARLHCGELIVQARIRPVYTRLPFVSVKKRRIGSVGYPVVTLAALKKDGQIRVALSGVCAFPFRSLPMETVLNETIAPVESRVQQAIRLLPAPLLDDTEASAEYRAFVLRNTLADAVQALEGVSG